MNNHEARQLVHGLYFEAYQPIDFDEEGGYYRISSEFASKDPLAKQWPNGRQWKSNAEGVSPQPKYADLQTALNVVTAYLLLNGGQDQATELAETVGANPDIYARYGFKESLYRIFCIDSGYGFDVNESGFERIFVDYVQTVAERAASKIDDSNHEPLD